MEILIVTLAFAGAFYIYRNSVVKNETRYKEKISLLEDDLAQKVQQLGSLFKQKKSSEVKTGNIAEKVAPFLDNFPCATYDIHFMGQPLDYVAFDEDGVHFVEVKSGNAQLSKKQRIIRDHIESKKVFWHVMRIK